jgi:hypothetical protein
MSTEFYLPLGLVWEGKSYRKGHIRLATTGDELQMQAADEVAVNFRYRDIMLLARVIEDLSSNDGGSPMTLAPVTVSMIENLFEADFLYLQLLYKQINDALPAHITTACPECGKRASINLPRLYDDMSLYREGV